MLSSFIDKIELVIRWLIVSITNYLPVKVIRDDNGVPFLYRYHILALTNDGPGICIHHFVKSDPDRGYHNHPWKRSLSFILAGRYSERIVDRDTMKYDTYERNRFHFNYLNGESFHRVMLGDEEDTWTLFFFGKRSKTWEMISLDGELVKMSNTIEDTDGGWWNLVIKGLGIHSHLKHDGNVIATVDNIILDNEKVLLIKRGKEPYKNYWALPGGRIEQKDDDIISAAKRELKEETNLDDIELEYVTTVGNNTRDPRGFCISNVFIGKLPEIHNHIKAGDDAVDYMWADINNLPDMAFDHADLITTYSN